jgi:hypothetical protein
VRDGVYGTAEGFKDLLDDQCKLLTTKVASELANTAISALNTAEQEFYRL